MTDIVIAHCRAGFEIECAGDIEHVAALAGMPLSIDAPRDRAFVTASGIHDHMRWSKSLAAQPPMFARSLFLGSGPHALRTRDRIAPIVARARQLGPPFQSVWLETADTNDGKRHSGLCRRLAPHLDAALALGGHARTRLRRICHVCTCCSKAANSRGSASATRRLAAAGRWAFQALSMPRDAPSRSTLKLAEAFVTFLADGERDTLLRPGMRAVDLGAAPGGWTWQLVQRGLSRRRRRQRPAQGFDRR